MPLTDAALSAATVNAAVLVFADFADLPLRYAFSACPLLVPAGLADGDADCWGQTFATVDERVLTISAPGQDAGGSATLTVTLAADPDNPALIAAIADPALYAGRRLRLWRALHDGAGTVVQIAPLAAATMTVPAEAADATQMIITMEAEPYLALVAAGARRTYLAQQRFDPNDDSAAITLGQGSVAPGIEPGSISARIGYDLA